MLYNADEVFEQTTVDLRDHTNADGEYLRMLADEIAADVGIASRLIRCPEHGTYQGIERVAHIQGTAYDFNASDNIELRCGCWLV